MDGLRAVAVLGVVSFHLDPAFAPGGFVGVDVFFVISGYLITGLILARRDLGTFSLREFYRRRALRLLPVLAVVTLAVLLAGSVLMTEADRAELARAALATSLSAANVYNAFLLDASYFAPETGKQPLLHAWSLGVEEQFYLLWPVMVLAAARRGVRTLLGMTAAVFVVSLTLSVLLTSSAPMAAYYLLPTRTFQLGAGAGVALLAREGWVLRDGSARAAGWAGLCVIVGSFALLSEEALYPGVWALVPTMGAALVIAAGVTPNRSVASRLLGVPALVAVGRASYVLYLWHWPVLAFWRYRDPVMGPADLVVATAVIAALTMVTHLTVERPVRESSARLGAALRTFAGYPAVVAITLAAVWPVVPTRTASDDAGAPALTLARRLPWVCQQPELTEAHLRAPRCVVGARPGEAVRVLVWGDSHAAHLVPYLRVVATEAGFGFRNVAHSSCPPLMDRPERFVPEQRVTLCRASGAAVAPEVARYEVIVLSASWSSYFTREGFAEALATDLAAHGAAGRAVILSGTAPRFPSADPNCLSESGWVGTPGCLDRYHAPLDERVVMADRELAALAAAMPHVAFAEPFAPLCHEGRCDAVREGRPLYWDHSHLNYWGADWLGRQAVADGEALAIFEAVVASVQ